MEQAAKAAGVDLITWLSFEQRGALRRQQLADLGRRLQIDQTLVKSTSATIEERWAAALANLDTDQVKESAKISRDVVQGWFSGDVWPRPDKLPTLARLLEVQEERLRWAIYGPDEELPNAVAALRRDREMTQRELADVLDCDPELVALWEAEVAAPTGAAATALEQMGVTLVIPSESDENAQSFTQFLPGLVTSATPCDRDLTPEALPVSADADSPVAAPSSARADAVAEDVENQDATLGQARTVIPAVDDEFRTYEPTRSEKQRARELVQHLLSLGRDYPDRYGYANDVTGVVLTDDDDNDLIAADYLFAPRQPMLRLTLHLTALAAALGQEQPGPHGTKKVTVSDDSLIKRITTELAQRAEAESEGFGSGAEAAAEGHLNLNIPAGAAPV